MIPQAVAGVLLVVLVTCSQGDTGESSAPAPETTATSTSTTISATTTTAPTTTTTTAPSPPAAGVAAICGDRSILNGPSSPPAGAIIVPAGDNGDFFLNEYYKGTEAPVGTVYYFESGVHTLGTSGQIIARSNATYLGAPGAILDGQGINNFAFTGQAANVTIKHLTVSGFMAIQNQGTINTDAGRGWTITRNTVERNRGAATMIGSDNVVTENCLRDNGQYGFNAYHPAGVSNIVLSRNEISGNNTEDWEAKVPGCGCAGAGKFWAVHGAHVADNWVHDNRGPGLWADFNNTEFLIEGNLIERNSYVGIWYEISYNFMIRNNTLRQNFLDPDGVGENFPHGAIYIAESGGDARAGDLYTTSEITGNLIEDNWDGVVLWEDPDRYCKSPAGGVSATCPFFDDTYGARNKTQNVWVHHNTFTFSKAAIGCVSSCGRNALFSKYGIYDYPGWTVSENITFHQNNRFTDNTYTGPWEFTVHDDRPAKSWETWTSAPYNQDPRSN